MNPIRQYHHVLAGAVRALLVVVCLAPLVVSPPTLFPFVVGKALFARGVIELAFALWLLLALYVPEHRPRRSWILVALLAWLGVSLLASLTGVSPTRSLWSTFERMQGVVDLGHWCAYALLLAGMFRTLGGWRLLLGVNVAAGAVVSAVGLAAHAGLLDVPQLLAGPRLGSTLGSGLFVGAYAMLNLGIGVGLLCLDWNRARPPSARGRGRRAGRRAPDWNPWARSAVGLALALNLAALWLSAARGALLGAVLMAVIFGVGCLIFGGTPRARRAALGLLGVTAVFVAVFAAVVFGDGLDGVAGSSVMARRLESAVGEDNSVNSRITAVRMGVLGYRDRPLLGWGPENYEAAWGRHITVELATAKVFDQAHSKVIEVAATTGTAGLFVYLLLCLLLAVAAIRGIRRRRGNERLFALAVATTLAGYFVQCVVMFDTLSFILQFAALAGYLAWEEGRSAPAGWGFSRSPVRWLAAQGWLSAVRWRAALTGRWASLAAALVIAGLLGWGLFQYNLRPWQSAQHRPIQGSLPEIVGNVRESSERFPPLANFRRVFLLTNADAVLPLVTDPVEVAASLELLEEEIALALAAEPESWRIHHAAALAYRAAASHDVKYLGSARRHLAELARRSPRSAYTEEARAALEAARGER